MHLVHRAWFTVMVFCFGSMLMYINTSVIKWYSEVYRPIAYKYLVHAWIPSCI